MEEIRGYDRYLAYMDYVIKNINQHLPRNRKSLSQLLNETEPHVETLDGGKLYFKTGDLERISKIIPKKHHATLRLPILLIRRINLGKGVFTVSGGNVERYLVKNVLGISCSLDEESGEFYLYKIHIQELLSKLGTLVVMGFEIPSEKGDY